MPDGKRTDRISERDLEVLEFIARYGVVPRSAVATWAGTARTVTIVRESRLRKAGLIRVFRGLGNSGPFSACTASGLAAAGRRELRPARVSASALSHDTVVAEVGAGIERCGETLLSEREIMAIERAEGDRILSAALTGGGFHRPDLVRIDDQGQPREAIEVELSTKGAAVLDELLRSWRRAVVERRFTGVIYHCAPRTRRFVEAAVERTRAAGAIKVQELSEAALMVSAFATSLDFARPAPAARELSLPSPAVRR